MKILGGNSLSSKVELALEVLFVIIALVDIAVIGIFGLIIISETTRYAFLENYLIQFISVIIVLSTFLATGLIALYIIDKFIKIFNNLKQNKLFEEKNVLCLNKIYISSIIMAILYFVVMIGINYFTETIIYGMGERLLLKILLFVFSIGFLIFGIGIKILNEIYIKAIKYKKENDLTI